MPHRTLADLEPHLDHLRAAPAEEGHVALVVARQGAARRRVLPEGRVGRRLRRLNTRVVVPGTVRPGDRVTVVHRDAMLDVHVSVG